MTVSKQNQTSAEPEEQRFVEKALASVEKARRFQRIKQIVFTTLACIAALWLAFSPSRPELGLETVVIAVGLIVGVCTTKIMSLINRNTKAVLQAIAELHQR